MTFKKIYIEITNSCNFNCSFCFKSERANKFMSVAEFEHIITSIRPFTDYIYLHVLGEPLLHPEFEKILSVAHEAKLYVNITTNGDLIKKRKEILLSQQVRQINISLHDAEENIKPEKWDEYLKTIFEYATEAASKTYINLRLWNSGVEESSAFNPFCIHKIAQQYDFQPNELILNGKDNGIKLANHIFLQHAPRFDWPDGERIRTGDKKNCYALRDHIAILSDGNVVPCCLDADAAINLGNIFTDDFKAILESERAQKIRKGFMNHTITEDFCKSCGFIIQ